MDDGTEMRGARILYILIGITILSLLAVRAFWRLFVHFRHQPSMIQPMARNMDRTRRHPNTDRSYGLLFAVPFAGVALQIARREPLPLYGVLEFPPTIVPDLEFVQNIEHLH